MARLCFIAAHVSRERGSYVFKKMPLRLVYTYEHIFYLREGYTVVKPQQSLEQLLSEI